MENKQKEYRVEKYLSEFFRLDYGAYEMDSARRISEALDDFRKADDAERAIRYALLLNEYERVKGRILSHVERLDKIIGRESVDHETR